MVWGKGSKVIKVPLAVGAKWTSNPFTKGARWVPLVVGMETIYCTKQAHKAHTNDLGKAQQMSIIANGTRRQ